MRADALIVLGCRVGPGGRLFGAARRRVERAASAWHEGVARFVVASGGKRWHGVAEARALADGLVERGVPPNAIALECLSYSTLENASFCARVLEARAATTTALVTCDWHMKRARSAFEAEGLSPLELPAPTPKTGATATWLRLARERASAWLDVRARWERPRP